MAKEKKDTSTNGRGFMKPEEVLNNLDIKEGFKIADFGCGSGYFTIPLAKRVGKSGVVYALDVQESALESVRGRAKLFSMLNVETVHANLEKERGSTLEDEYLHMVVLANTLFQVEDKSVILKEVKRVLNKDGKMVVIEWSSDAPIVPQYGHRISKDDLKKLAKELDFVLEKEFSAGNSHYGLVFSL